MTTQVLVDAPDTVRMDPQDALRQLIESDGFRLHLEYVRTEWGAAALNRKTLAVLQEHPPADHSAMIQALHGTAESIRRLFAWPEEEYERLRTRSQQTPEVSDRFAQHRRTL